MAHINEEAVPGAILVILCIVFVFRIGIILVDLFRHRLTPKYTILRHLPQSLIVKVPVRGVSTVCQDRDTPGPIGNYNMSEQVEG